MTMNDELKSHLGQGNCGPVEFSEHEQLAITKQIVAERIQQSGLIPKELSQLDPLSCLYGDANRYCDPDIIKSYTRHEDISPVAATQRLAMRLGTSCGGIFGTDLSSGRQGPPHRLPGTQYLSLQTSTCSRTFGSPLYLHKKAWTLSTILQYSASDGDFVAGEAIYSDQDTGEYFALNIYADRSSEDVPKPFKELHLGYQYKQYRLAGEDLMLDKPELPIVIFHDKRIAGFFLGMDGLAFVPSTFGGRYDDISDVCLEHLSGKTVFIIPLASKESYWSLGRQAEAVQKAGAIKVAIATIPLLLYPKKTSEDEQFVVSGRLTRHIVMKSQVIVRNGGPAFDLKGHCLTPQEFQKWAYGYGLTSEEQIGPLRQSSTVSALLNNKTEQSDRFILEKIFAPGELSALIGDTHSGKTLVGYTLALALGFGFDVFGFSSSGGHHVLYVDAETPKGDGAKNVAQVAAGYGISPEKVDEFFHPWFVKGRPLASSLNKEDGRHQIEKEIETVAAKFVIFDNLITLAPRVFEASTRWENLLSWFTHLYSQYGVAVLFMHHLGKDGTPLGLTQIQATSRNIFSISKNSGEVQKAPGCFMNLEVQKNKRYPSLDRLKTAYFLEFHDTYEDGTPWYKIENDQPVLSTVTYNDSLSPGENAILKHIFEQGEANRKDIEKILKCSSGTVRNRLKPLLLGQYIETIGSGPSTRYVLRKQTMDAKGRPA